MRQYFPKGTDLSVHGPEDLELGWDTPAERLLRLVQSTWCCADPLNPPYEGRAFDVSR